MQHNRHPGEYPDNLKVTRGHARSREITSARVQFNKPGFQPFAGMTNGGTIVRLFIMNKKLLHTRELNEKTIL